MTDVEWSPNGYRRAGYMLMVKTEEGLIPTTHQLNSDTGHFPMVIFKTQEEAQKYSLPNHIIKKVWMETNITNLNKYYDEQR